MDRRAEPVVEPFERIQKHSSSGRTASRSTPREDLHDVGWVLAAASILKSPPLIWSLAYPEKKIKERAHREIFQLKVGGLENRLEYTYVNKSRSSLGCERN